MGKKNLIKVPFMDKNIMTKEQSRLQFPKIPPILKICMTLCVYLSVGTFVIIF